MDLTRFLEKHISCFCMRIYHDSRLGVPMSEKRNIEIKKYICYELFKMWLGDTGNGKILFEMWSAS